MSSTTTRCALWLIEREDEKIFAVTDHDVDVEHEGQIYRARQALDASQIETKIGFSQDNFDILGAVDAEVFTSEDLHSGLFENAKITYSYYDWQKQKLTETLFEGRISTIEFSENHFRADVKSKFEKLDSVFGRSYVKTCHAQFCDQRCGLAEVDYSLSAKVIRADGQIITIDVSDLPWPAENGILEFSGRARAIGRLGIEKAQRTAEGLKLTLWQRPKFAPKAGENLRIIAGCDKTLSSCANRFHNAINFRGFPHMPGEQIYNEQPNSSNLSKRG